MDAAVQGSLRKRPLLSMTFIPALYVAMVFVAGVYASLRFAAPLGAALLYCAAFSFAAGIVALVTFCLRHRPSRGRTGYVAATMAGSLALVVSLAGLQAAPIRALAGQRPPSLDPSNPAKVEVMVSRQSAEGVTKEQLSLVFLRNFERYALNQANEKFGRSLRDNGIGLNGRAIRSKGAVYLEVSSQKLAIVRMTGPAGIELAEIVGIKGDELIRVLCMSPGSLVVTHGPCGQRIGQEFGIRLGD